MNGNNYSYFDESYFQDGSKRGTAYVNYREGARSSQVFREIAFAIKEIFQPKRVLDVGCATGAIVYRLNELGCEAFGVDVSEWAVRNAEHSNVRLASADDLPFSDNYFDLVISCHSMEHLPPAVFDRSLAEINRVTSAFHFHMLPMIGTPPYDGDPATVREQLRKDPTHQQLHSQEWWLERFQLFGCSRVETCILLKNETSTAELSIGQFLLKKTTAIEDSVILQRCRARNQRIFREIQLGRMTDATGTLGITAAGRLTFTNRIWKDVERKLFPEETIYLADKTIQLVVIVEGNPCTLRFAAGQDVPGQQYAHVGEFLVLAKPGCNVFKFSTDQLRTLRGNPDYSAINHLALGGEGENTEVLFYLADQFGTALLA